MTLALSNPAPYADPSELAVVPTSDGDQMAKAMSARLDYAQGWLGKYDAYFIGEQPIAFMQKALERELEGRIQPLVINWPRLGVRSFENRIDIEGFRYADTESGDEAIWDIWQANNLDEQSQQAHVTSLALGRSYVIVGAGDSRDDAPVISVESPFQMTTIRDPRTRKIIAGFKRWMEADSTTWACLYEPNMTRTMASVGGKWITTRTDEHNLGRCPVAVLPNDPELLRPDGRSIFHDVLPLADAANKMATDMMVSGEFHAMPRRWAFGLEQKDFVGPDGQPKSAWSAIAGRLWANKDKEIKVGQFDEADLAVFHNTIKLLAQLASQIFAFPPHYMGFTGNDAASADAIRSSESQLVKIVERMFTYLGGGWEDVNRIALRIQTGVWDPRARSLETVFRDPSTPTIAQSADAVVKKVQAGIIPIEQAREDLGYGPIARKRMAEMDERQAARGASVFRDALNPPVPDPATV